MIYPADFIGENERQGALDLCKLVTVKEAGMLWCKHPRTIQHHVDAGTVRYRRTSWVILILVEDLVELYGIPCEPQGLHNLHYLYETIMHSIEGS